MSFRNLIQDMRGDFGSISRHGMRSRSHRAGGSAPQGAAAEPLDAMGESCWAQLPHELLREVLVRIEASEDRWPARRDVVSCAGVCRTWRGIMKEAVRVPEKSGQLSFPISLKQVWPFFHRSDRRVIRFLAAAAVTIVRVPVKLCLLRRGANYRTLGTPLNSTK
jgi:tubby and related proteins